MANGDADGRNMFADLQKGSIFKCTPTVSQSKMYHKNRSSPLLHDQPGFCEAAGSSVQVNSRTLSLPGAPSEPLHLQTFIR